MTSMNARTVIAEILTRRHAEDLAVRERSRVERRHTGHHPKKRALTVNPARPGAHRKHDLVYKKGQGVGEGRPIAHAIKRPTLHKYCRAIDGGTDDLEGPAVT